MARIHPATEEAAGKALKGNTLDSFINQNVLGVKDDERSRQTWLDRQFHYYNRRYCRVDRRTNWPWPGASDIVMPLMDMTIDRLKSTLMRMVFSSPMVSFQAHHPDFQEQSRTDEQYFNWKLKFGIPDFRDNIVIALDYVLQYGFAPLKTFWDYQSAKVQRTFVTQDIPNRYLEFLELTTSLVGSQLAAGEEFDLSPADVLSEQASDRALAALKPLIAQDYGIDAETKEGQKALEEIVKGIRQRTPQVRYQAHEVLRDNPTTIPIDPQDFLIGWSHNCTETAPRVTHRIFLSEQSFRARAKERGWNESAVNVVLDRFDKTSGAGATDSYMKSRAGPLRDQYHNDRAIREGIDEKLDRGGVQIQLYETHTWFDLDGDGVDEKVVALIEPETGVMMTDLEYEPYEHAMRPFDQLVMELNDDRYYSPRGVPEKLDDIDWEITLQHRNKLNAMDMAVPSFTYRSTSQVDPDAIHWIPGEFYPVSRPDDINVLSVPDRSFMHEREEMTLLTWNERYLGGFDALSTQGTLSEARTATEINALQRSGAEALAYRGQILQMRLKSVYYKLWALDNQWGDEQEYERVTGRPRRRLSPLELRRNFEIVPVGTVERSDPAVESQRAFNRFQTLFQLQQQTGPVLDQRYKIEIGEALIRWLEREDVVDARAIVRRLTQEEIAQAAQEQTEQAAEQNLATKIQALQTAGEVEKSFR